YRNKPREEIVRLSRLWQSMVYVVGWTSWGRTAAMTGTLHTPSPAGVLPRGHLICRHSLRPTAVVRRRTPTPRPATTSRPRPPRPPHRTGRARAGPLGLPAGLRPYRFVVASPRSAFAGRPLRGATRPAQPRSVAPRCPGIRAAALAAPRLSAVAFGLV